jgi:hypothetical protein
MGALEQMFPGIDLPERLQCLSEGGPGSGPHPGLAKAQLATRRATRASDKASGGGPHAMYAADASKYGDSRVAADEHEKQAASHKMWGDYFAKTGHEHDKPKAEAQAKAEQLHSTAAQLHRKIYNDQLAAV